MRSTLIAALILLGTLATPATAQVHVSIGLNLPSYPALQRVPNYPVYYAPRLNSNYFFYDGLYWVYEGDTWYASSWYNGPWEAFDRFDVPVYLLRVPVRYYRSAPVYFRGWRADAPPRWSDHWGSSWSERRSGWDRWNRSSAPAPAPLPVYQRQYTGSRYPQVSQQVVITTQNYRYQPREVVVKQRFDQYRAAAPARQQVQREATRRVAPQSQPQAQAQAPSMRGQRSDGPGPPQGHPPGKAKGWEGADRPPGQAKGWDQERVVKEKVVKEKVVKEKVVRTDDRGKGNDRDDDDRGKGRDKENPGKGRDR